MLIESPFAGDETAHKIYARRAMRDALLRGEAPLASHLIYTQPGILDDAIPAERRLGMAAGFAWGRAASASVVYADFGISPGMEEGIARAAEAGRPVETRFILRGRK